MCREDAEDIGVSGITSLVLLSTVFTSGVVAGTSSLNGSSLSGGAISCSRLSHCACPRSFADTDAASCKVGVTVRATCRVEPAVLAMLVRLTEVLGSATIVATSCFTASLMAATLASKKSWRMLEMDIVDLTRRLAQGANRLGTLHLLVAKSANVFAMSTVSDSFGAISPPELAAIALHTTRMLPPQHFADSAMVCRACVHAGWHWPEPKKSVAAQDCVRLSMPVPVISW
mmetsp:Transcript_393/g.734  ORF Transcript_393/g.734 Transcript_393/m.734 type:complete len:230 (-) Transcript_393:1025-1714(-)